MANVGYATLQIIPSAKGFTTALQGQVAPGMATAGSASSKKFGSSFIAGFKGIAGPLAAVAGTAAVANFFKGAISGASDLNETLSKTNVIFGDATKAVVKFAEDSSRNILLTKQEALDASATFGVFGKSAGLSGKDLATFSTDLTALASDLSSFSNTTTDEAIVALGAALRGESEPIRRYGVLLDDASLRQEALRQGLIRTTKTALTPQQRVLAAQALIFKQTRDAQGDAERTAAGFANQTRILRKNFIDIRNEVGAALLPVVTKLTTIIAENLRPAFEAIKTALAPIVNAFRGLSGEGGKVNGLTRELSNTFQAWATYVREVYSALRPIVEQVFARLQVGFAQIGEILRNDFLPAIQSILPVITPVVKFLIRTVGAALVGALNGALNVIKGVLKAISGVFNVFAGLFTGDWKKLWGGIKQIFSGVWSAIVGLVQVALNSGIIGILRRAGQALIAIGKSALTGLKNAFVSGLQSIVQLMTDLPRRILSALGSIGRLLISAGRNLLAGFISGIRSQASALITAIKETITDKLPGFVKSALGIASPSKVFAEIGKDVGLGFIKGVQGTRDKIRDTFAKLAEDIRKTGSKRLIEAVADAQKKILDLAQRRDILRDRFDEAKDSLRDLKEAARDYVKQVSDAIVATGNLSQSRSFDGIIRNLTSAVSQATEFSKLITGLKRAGLNNTSLQQLIEAGPENALASARALLASGEAGVATVNALQTELQKQGKAIGETISGAVYDAAISDAEKAVTKIGKDLTDIEKKIVGVAAALAREISKIGGIKAPEWLKSLMRFTDLTVQPNRATGIGNAPRGGNFDPATVRLGNERGRTVVVNNYNPVAEKTSVTVSNTLTRLALLGR